MPTLERALGLLNLRLLPTPSAACRLFQPIPAKGINQPVRMATPSTKTCRWGPHTQTPGATPRKESRIPESRRRVNESPSGQLYFGTKSGLIIRAISTGRLMPGPPFTVSGVASHYLRGTNESQKLDQDGRGSSRSGCRTQRSHPRCFSTTRPSPTREQHRDDHPAQRRIRT